MKLEGYLFAFLAAFLFLVGAGYFIWSGDWTGGVALLFGGGLGTITGTYLLFTASRMEPRPEDRPDAEVDEGSGEIGFFSPHSWWPIALAASVSMLTLGAIFGIWLLLFGIFFTLVAVSGLILEYYVGDEAQ
jgi:Cytochrome c oxidase subunit IV